MASLLAEIDYRTRNPNRIFSDFCADFPRVKDFYSGDPRAISQPGSGPELKPLSSPIARTLSEFNSGLPGTRPDSLREKTANPLTVFVFTGQQTGLLGGPLYSLYKGLTAAALAARLEKAWKRPVVPVFWLATEDHDLSEIRSVTIPLGKKPSLHLSLEDQRLPAGRYSVSETHASGILAFINQFRETEFSAECKEMLRTVYAKGAAYGRAFTLLMSRWLGPQGLYFFDPLDAAIQPMVQQFLQSYYAKRQLANRAVQDQDRRLQDSGYHRQVELGEDHSGLFRFDPDGRRHKVSLSEPLLPEKNQLSAGVLVRPLLESWLFPVAAHVAGPSEVAYFAQIKPLYKLFDLSMPVIYPRHSMTLCTAAGLRFMEKIGVKPEKILVDPEGFNRYLKEKVETDEVLVQLQAVKEAQLQFFDRQSSGVGSGPALEESKRIARGKIEFALEGLVKRCRELNRRRSREVLSQWEHLQQAVFTPGGQERQINVHYFLFLYGEPLLEKLFSIVRETDPFTHKFVVI
jgi:uncharacterized protein YllA (UPF0747 family)